MHHCALYVQYLVIQRSIRNAAKADEKEFDDPYGNIDEETPKETRHEKKKRLAEESKIANSAESFDAEGSQSPGVAPSSPTFSTE